MYPERQGFYAKVRGQWRPALGVPCLHLLYPHEDMAVLMRDFCYVDRHGCPHVATEGFPFNGLSIPRVLWRVAGHPWGRNLAAGCIHDSDCALAQALPPGEDRARLRSHADDRFQEMLMHIPNPRGLPTTWKLCVRPASLLATKRPAAPDYRLNLEGYYLKCGLTSEIVAMTLDGWAERRPCSSV